MKRSLKFLAVLAIVSMVVAMGLPAFAKGGKGKGKGQGRGGKKAVGTVVSYEPAANLLVASMKDGSTFTGTVAEDVKVKLDHRGNNGENKRKKPSNGDETDILPGAEILKLKVKCDEVTKLRLRAGTGTEPVEEPEVEEPEVEEPEVEEPDGVDDGTDGDDDGGLLDPLLRTASDDEGDDDDAEETDDPDDDSDDSDDSDDADDTDDDSDDTDDDADDTDDDSDDTDDDADEDEDETDDDSDDCDADEDEDETDDDSDDLDEDLDDELDDEDDSDEDDDSADDSDDSDDDDDLVECVVTDLEDCLS